jgi:hypothetical protein
MLHFLLIIAHMTLHISYKKPKTKIKGNIVQIYFQIPKSEVIPVPCLSDMLYMAQRRSNIKNAMFRFALSNNFIQSALVLAVLFDSDWFKHCQ